jgi:virginiamycin B lyase
VVLTIVAATVLAALALLIAPPHAHGNFVYWSSGSPNSSIGRAKINGTGLNRNFITGLGNPDGVAVDSRFVYWSDRGNNTIGRANLDGTGINPSFIATGVDSPVGVAVNGSGIYWGNNPGGGPATISHANLDGTSPGVLLNPYPEGLSSLVVDANFVYWPNVISSMDTSEMARAALDGSGSSGPVISGVGVFNGLAVDPSFLYWATGPSQSVARAPIAGPVADQNFLPPGATGGDTTGVAVNPQYIFWGNYATGGVGRANVNGNSPSPALIPGAGITGPFDASELAAAPSNKITVNSITRKKKKGTAAINANVPGPGQLTLNQISTPPDVNATAASVKQVGLTIPQATSFTVPVKSQGKTAKKLKKQLKKKRKAKVKVNVFIHFVPAGVAGVPNTQQVAVTLIKQRKKK